MLIEKPRLEWRGVILSVVAMGGMAVIALGGVASDRPRPPDEHPRWHALRTEPTLAERLDAVDAAIAQQNVRRAAYEWRVAYSLALRSRRWQAMADIGDAAVRIDALAGRPGGRPTNFRAEARQAYLRALFQARHERARDGVERVAQAFAGLGDREMAAHARAIAVAP
jgi:hypothetical protein